MSLLGKNIRKIRNNWDMGQADFADLMDVKSAQVISSYETSEKIPKLPFLVKFIKISGISLPRLCDEEILSKDIPVSPITSNIDQGENLKVEQGQTYQKETLQLVQKILERIERLEKTINQ